MALALGTPVAPYDYLVTGTGSWADLVALIANAADMTKIDETYIVTSKISIEATMGRLLSSAVISRSGGGWSVHNGGKVYFGETVTFHGEDFFVRGCDLIEEASAWSRGSENFGNNTCRFLGATSRFELINSSWKARLSARSDFDFADGTLYIRDAEYNVKERSFDHFYCVVDIAGFKSDHDFTGTNFEFSAATVINRFDSVEAYQQTIARQIVFWIDPGIPIVEWGGLNFARRFAVGTVYFDNPVSASLYSMDYLFGADAYERRTVDVVISKAGTPIQARVTVEDALGVIEHNSLTDAGGELNLKLTRQYWGAATHTPEAKTPHIIRIHKYGYISQELSLDVAPAAAYNTGYDLPTAISNDLNIADTKTNALAHTGITITYEAAPVAWKGKGFSITVKGDLSVNPVLTPDDIFHYIQAKNDDGTTYGGRQTHQLLRVPTETQTGEYFDGTKGVRVIDEVGDEFHGMEIMYADDGTFLSFIPVVLSNISVVNMPILGANIRLQITNDTAKTAGAWAATAAYSLGDKVLRSIGLGSELTAGLYFVATTAGTSGGTEPTWNTSVDGTTVDGTVTWTTYAILYQDGDPAASSFLSSYVDGEEFIDGDTFTVRFAEMDGATSFKTFDTSGIVTATGAAILVSADSDLVYAINAVDGASAGVTGKFTADYANNEVDLDTNLDFAITEAFAYYAFELTNSIGMYVTWGGVDAIDPANYRNNVDVFSLFFDETAGFVKQTDNARWFRSDGTRPARDPTTGGNGIEITGWRNPVYGFDAGGGGFTSGDRAELFKNTTILDDTADMQPKIGTPAADISADIAAVKSDTAGTKTTTDQITFTVANKVDSNVKSVNDVTVTGTGVEGSEWGP